MCMRACACVYDRVCDCAYVRVCGVGVCVSACMHVSARIRGRVSPLNQTVLRYVKDFGLNRAQPAEAC